MQQQQHKKIRKRQESPWISICTKQVWLKDLNLYKWRNQLFYPKIFLTCCVNHLSGFFFFKFNLRLCWHVSTGGSQCGNKLFFFVLAVSHVNIFHHHLTLRTILTQYQKVKDQIGTFEILETKYVAAGMVELLFYLL